jgi:hypothetical protein
VLCSNASPRVFDELQIIVTLRTVGRTEKKSFGMRQPVCFDIGFEPIEIFADKLNVSRS